jgi:hypothetical protein
MDPRRTLIAALAAPLVLLGACGGNDASVADPPISPGSTSSSPTTPPKRETPEHFIRRWAEAEKAMQNSGRTDAYLSMSKGCEACGVLARIVTRYYARGGYIHWAGWSIRSIRHYPSSSGSVSFAVSALSAPTTFRKSATSNVQHLKGAITYVITLSPATGPFHVAAKAQLDQ